MMENGLFYSEEALLNRVLFLSDFSDVIFLLKMSLKNIYMKILWNDYLVHR